jgi:hypothetical protein
MTRRPLLLLSLIATCLLAGCAGASNPTLVELNDAAAYSGAETATVLSESRVEIGIGGVRAVEGGALIDVVLTQQPKAPEHNRIRKALDIGSDWPTSELTDARKRLAAAAGSLESRPEISRYIRLSGADGPVGLAPARLSAKDPHAATIPVFIGELVCPASSTFESNGRTFIVQPIAVRTDAPLKPGEYTVELTPEFVGQLFPHTLGAGGGRGVKAVTARVVVETLTHADAPASLDGF